MKASLSIPLEATLFCIDPPAWELRVSLFSKCPFSLAKTALAPTPGEACTARAPRSTLCTLRFRYPAPISAPELSPPGAAHAYWPGASRAPGSCSLIQPELSYKPASLELQLPASQHLNRLPPPVGLGRGASLLWIRFWLLLLSASQPVFWQGAGESDLSSSQLETFYFLPIASRNQIVIPRLGYALPWAKYQYKRNLRSVLGLSASPSRIGKVYTSPKAEWVVLQFHSTNTG